MTIEPVVTTARVVRTATGDLVGTTETGGGNVRVVTTDRTTGGAMTDLAVRSAPVVTTGAVTTVPGVTTASSVATAATTGVRRTGPPRSAPRSRTPRPPAGRRTPG